MIPRILILLGLCALVIVIALAITDPAHGAGRPKAACVGVVIGYIDPGMEFVRRKDGSKCLRPSTQPVKHPVKVRR